MPKMSGARLFAEMMRGYGVTHIFFVPAFMLKSFAEMRNADVAPHPWTSTARDFHSYQKT